MCAYRYFHSFKNNADYCLQKSGPMLCLFKKNEKSQMLPVLAKKYGKEEGGFKFIRRYNVINDDNLIPTTSIFQRDGHPVAFTIHKNYGKDFIGTLMNGRVVAVVEDDNINLRSPQRWEPSPMGKRLILKICDFLNI